VRLGIFGGSFDPPHVGHLLVAVDALERLELDRVMFVPAATQPLKAGAMPAPAADRMAMVRLLCGDDPRFAADPIEIERDGLSYTVETLATIRRREGDAELFFLVGADIARTFARWREPLRVLQLAQMVVLRRSAEASPGADEEWLPHGADRSPSRAPIELESRMVDVSSTEVRARLRERKSIHGFVPDAIAAYIARTGLYR
jgi:nicotinate-nucleotide adenylyltransferase